MKPKLVTRTLSELKETFFVRIALDQEHVAHLRGLGEGGAELPPLIITPDNELVGGRHRKASYEQRGLIEVECEVREYDSQAAMIIDALRDNVGGALPPKPQDITHTMELLLAQNMTRVAIIQQVSDLVGFPRKLVKRHLDDVNSKLRKAKISRGLKLIGEGKTVKEAADAEGIEVKVLKKQLQKQAGDDDTDGATDVRKTNAWINAKFRSVNSSVGQNLGNVIRQLGDELLTPAQGREIIENFSHLVDRLVKQRDQWVKRFQARIGTTESLTKTDAVEPRNKKSRGPYKKRNAGGTSNIGQKALARMGLGGRH